MVVGLLVFGMECVVWLCVDWCVVYCWFLGYVVVVFVCVCFVLYLVVVIVDCDWWYVCWYVLVFVRLFGCLVVVCYDLLLCWC